MKGVDFAGLVFKGLTRKILLSPSSQMKQVITVNSEMIVRANENESFKNIICENYATFDGQVPYYFARKKFPDLTFEKISGSDFIYDICENASLYKKRVFLLGGYLKSNQGAVARLGKLYDIEISGFSPEYQPHPFSSSHNKTILGQIRQFSPQYLLVGFGAEKQEFWIQENRAFLQGVGVELAVGIGGTFEFVSNEIKRAPKIFQRLGLEGVYRLIQQPNKMRLLRLIKSTMAILYMYR